MSEYCQNNVTSPPYLLVCIAAAGPNLTHLSLAFLCRENGSRYAFKSLPALPQLEHFNAAGVGLSAHALDSLLASSSGTLQTLYLPSTTIPRPASAIDILVKHRLPKLRSLDLADARVSEAALKDLLVSCAPSLQHLFLVEVRIKGLRRDASHSSRALEILSRLRCPGLDVHVQDVYQKFAGVLDPQTPRERQMVILGEVIVRHEYLLLIYKSMLLMLFNVNSSREGCSA
eukprot:tig00020675_g12651.t1